MPVILSCLATSLGNSKLYFNVISKVSLISELNRLCPGGVKCNVPLGQLSRWKIGGTADVLVEPGTIRELSVLRAFLAREGLPNLVIGEASNLLFSDEGLKAICIRIGSRLSAMSVEGRDVSAEGGIWVPCLARKIMQSGLAGAEHICGIPGTLGGLIVMNGGSQRKGIGSSVVSVMAIAPDGGEVALNKDACGFGYRQSVFQKNGAVVVSARLRFESAIGRSVVRRKMLNILHDRNRKFPRRIANCGSVFKSHPGMYAAVGPPGQVIEQLGLKGYKIGDAQVSSKHANFFVNLGNASARDMMDLIRLVGDSVFKATGYRMESEVLYVSTLGEIGPVNY